MPLNLSRLNSPGAQDRVQFELDKNKAHDFSLRDQPGMVTCQVSVVPMGERSKAKVFKNLTKKG